MSIEDDIAFFESVPSLALLGRDALRILAIGAENRYVHKGTVLFHEGDAADAGYVILDGTIGVSAKHDGTAPPQLLRSGALIGELALLTEGVRPVTATAVEPTTVIRISRSLFLKMLEGYPDAALRLREHIARRADEIANAIRNVRSTFGER